MNEMKVYIKNYFIGLLILLAIIMIYQFAAVASLREVFITSFLTEIETIQDGGAAFTRGTVNWENFRNFLIFAFIAVYSILFLLFIIIEGHRRKKIEEDLEKKIQEAIYKKINGLDDYELQHYPEINKIIVDNLTEIEEYKELLSKEMEETKEALAFLAHDLKTPLTSAVGYLQILEMEDELSQEAAKKYSMIALKNVRRLDHLIQQFFALIKVNLNSIQFHKVEFNIFDLLSEIVENFYPKLLKRNIDIDIKIDQDLIIYGDAEYLSRVFINIINNAVLYTIEGSTIFILGEEDGSIVSIKIKNKTENIDSLDVDRLFLPFYRMEESRNQNTGGSGLGLSIAKEIVRKHDGVILAYKEGDYLTIQIDLKIGIESLE